MSTFLLSVIRQQKFALHMINYVLRYSAQFEEDIDLKQVEAWYDDMMNNTTVRAMKNQQKLGEFILEKVQCFERK